eukprot:CAMPEP_0202013274 /NCGR_PEP_ID=MMETSP0905-20130828/25697_1 /ASSEMBLY_ACC=CAM_ASM_000554 /TAXON_ID=420261 /ORGANISM="Thalassiosira antarctica, Strain CCMP982" /LENGTH=41 /DNA_ID= /DNA_START= /DNA_END= /DNA_ORIENTATION=
MKDVPTKALKEEFVGVTEQKQFSKDAVMKDAPTAPLKEESA